MRNSIVILFFVAGILLGLNSNVYAQYERLPEVQSKWVFGGNFGLGFSTYGSNILISPQIGYRITPMWEAGTRLTYNYASYKSGPSKVGVSYYGGGFYSSYEIFRGLFAHVENEWLSYQPVYLGNNGLFKDDRRLVHSFFIGGGYRQYFSSVGFASITVLYNLNETFDSPYNNPLIRVGFGFGF
jgi:hypothetical protein